MDIVRSPYAITYAPDCIFMDFSSVHTTYVILDMFVLYVDTERG